MTYSFHSKELGISVVFSSNVVKEMQRYKQNPREKEAGGLLFSALKHRSVIKISKATTPTWWDNRLINRFTVNSKRAQKTINKYFKKNLHYIGDWHTHPEKDPRPSDIDMSTIKDIFLKSDHQLVYLLLVIMTSEENFAKSYIALVNSERIYNCTYIDSLMKG